MNKLGFTEHAAELLSCGEFSDLYREYQFTYDQEMSMLASSICNMLAGGNANTYRRLSEKVDDEEKIISF